MQKLLLLPLVPALLACRPVGTDYRRPATPLPGRLAPTEVTGADPWAGLHDPVLDALVRQALASGPDVAAAQARLRQARGLQGVQDAQGGPNLAFGAKAARDHLSRNGEMFANVPLPDPKVDFDNFQAGFDASWEVDLFGRTRRLAEGAAARTRGASARVEDARLVVAAEVARNVVEARAWQARIALAGESRAALDELLRLARLSRDAGETSDVELRATEASREAWLSTLPALEAGLRQNLGALSVLTGLGVEEVARRLEPARELGPVPPPPAAGL
ncbi:MAG TPA: TolC family protein, partial [Holophaga sp.]|nr:TolC family protein [Holophaga sp.]